MKTSNEMCDRIVALMRQSGMKCKEVNTPELDPDSVVEYVVDVDVVAGGYIWNVRLDVVRFARDDGQYDHNTGCCSSDDKLEEVRADQISPQIDKDSGRPVR